MQEDHATLVLRKFESLINYTAQSYPVDMRDDIRQELRLEILNRLKDKPEVWLSRSILASEFQCCANEMLANNRACGVCERDGEKVIAIRHGENRLLADALYAEDQDET